MKDVTSAGKHIEDTKADLTQQEEQLNAQIKELHVKSQAHMGECDNLKREADEINAQIGNKDLKLKTLKEQEMALLEQQQNKIKEILEKAGV